MQWTGVLWLAAAALALSAVGAAYRRSGVIDRGRGALVLLCLAAAALAFGRAAWAARQAARPTDGRQA